MKIGFYYHLNVSLNDGNIYMPSLLGVFVDNLSTKVDQLTLFAHVVPHDVNSQDYALHGNNISCVDIGKKRNFMHRLLLGNRTLKHLSPNDVACDVMLVRAPTPLAPALYNRFSKICPVVYMLVGDYIESHSPKFSLNWLLDNLYEKMVNTHVFPKCLTMVNSLALEEKYNRISRNTIRIKTTTLSEGDFYFREDTCVGRTINLLYVGRFDWQKGFKEIFESISVIKNEIDVVLHIVGWDDDKNEKNTIRMRDMINLLGIQDNVIFEGYKRMGPDLNEMYRKSDIFILPSYAEGFPRCIRESMANGLPVIATKVGGIPGELTHGMNSLLIPPHDTQALCNAIIKMVGEKTLRKKIIQNAYNDAREATLDIQNDRIVTILKNEIKNSSI